MVHFGLKWVKFHCEWEWHLGLYFQSPTAMENRTQKRRKYSNCVLPMNRSVNKGVSETEREIMEKETGQH